MSDTVRVNGAQVERAAKALFEAGFPTPPQHVRALILAAAHELEENSPCVQASRAGLARKAGLSEEEAERVLEALGFIGVFLEVDREGVGFPPGLNLHPLFGWRGDDAAEHERVLALYPNPIIDGP